MMILHWGSGSKKPQINSGKTGRGETELAKLQPGEKREEEKKPRETIPTKERQRKRKTGEKRKKEEEEMADHAKKTQYRAKVICEKKRKGKQNKLG